MNPAPTTATLTIPSPRADGEASPIASRKAVTAAAGSGAEYTAPTTATPQAPAASSSGTRATVTPAMAMTGTSTAEAMASMPLGPSASGSPPLVVVA